MQTTTDFKSVIIILSFQFNSRVFILLWSATLRLMPPYQNAGMGTSDHCVDLNKNDSTQSVEAFDKLVTEENESLDNVNPCETETEETLEGLSIENFTASSGLIEPFIGMKFKSVEDARKLYQVYGLRTGFTVRINRKRRSRTDNKWIGQEFVCSREGLRPKQFRDQKSCHLSGLEVMRTGCNAMLLVSLRAEGNWVVTKFIKEHNHVLASPEKVRLRRPAKKLHNEDEKDREIKKLQNELRSERQRWEKRCALYEEKLNAALRVIEESAGHLSEKVQNIAQNIKDFEDAEAKRREATKMRKEVCRISETIECCLESY